MNTYLCTSDREDGENGKESDGSRNDTRISGSISVSSLADQIGISQVYLNKCFQKELGVSVQHFIIDYRLNRAANLLTGTSDSVSEIAALVGYNDPLAFSRSFKKKFNESPTVYRNKSYSPIIYDVE